jgi:hypothetical protein
MAAAAIAAYTIAAAAAIIWLVNYLPLAATRTSAAQLLANPLYATLIFLPVFIGLLLTILMGRFWVWPYIYLAALLQSMVPLGINFEEEIFAYVTKVVLVVFVLVAEGFGLMGGKLLHRFIGIAFFFGAGAWLLIQGRHFFGSQPDGEQHNFLMTLAGGLFFVHALVQVENYVVEHRLPGSGRWQLLGRLFSEPAARARKDADGTADKVTAGEPEPEIPGGDIVPAGTETEEQPVTNQEEQEPGLETAADNPEPQDAEEPALDEILSKAEKGSASSKKRPRRKRKRH